MSDGGPSSFNQNHVIFKSRKAFCRLGCLHSKIGVRVPPQVGSEILISNDKKSNLSPMASDLSVPIASAATAGSAGRSKVALKPGRSLMDWVRLTHSGKDLTGTGGKCLEVSPRELAKHNTRKDAWIALTGRVYNITHYLEYHPGGEEELMRGAGRDATDLFNEVHRWVNAESMLQKCFVGFLKNTWSFDVPKFLTLKHLKIKHKPDIVPDNTCKEQVTVSDNACKESLNVLASSCEHLDNVPGGIDLKIYEEQDDDDVQKNKLGKSVWPVSPLSELGRSESEVSIRFDEDGDYIKLLINNSSIKHHGLITDLVDRRLFVKFSDPPPYILNIEFPTEVDDDYKVGTPDEHVVEILFLMLHKFKKRPGFPSFSQGIYWTLSDPNDQPVYWSCKMVSKVPVNYNTFLFTFLLPMGTKMWVPVGHHIHIKSDIEGMEVIRSYTPILSSLNAKIEDCDELDGSKIVLMIKIYQMGAITHLINNCNIGGNMLISNYTGSFSEMLLTACDSVTLLAAGTGITPMIKIIHWIVNAEDKKRSIVLLFFNKTEEDILWGKELKSCEAIYKKFRIINILSEPNEKWTGLAGTLDTDLIDQLLNATLPDYKQQIFICGPLPFTETAIRCLEEAGYSQDDIYAFTGQ